MRSRGNWFENTARKFGARFINVIQCICKSKSQSLGRQESPKVRNAKHATSRPKEIPESTVRYRNPRIPAQKQSSQTSNKYRIAINNNSRHKAQAIDAISSSYFRVVVPSSEIEHDIVDIVVPGVLALSVSSAISSPSTDILSTCIYCDGVALRLATEVWLHVTSQSVAKNIGVPRGCAYRERPSGTSTEEAEVIRLSRHVRFLVLSSATEAVHLPALPIYPLCSSFHSRAQCSVQYEQYQEHNHDPVNRNHTCREK